METFSFPYHKFSTEYPETGFRMQLGNSYQYSAAPVAPDQRVLRLYFDTMVFFPTNVFKTNVVPTALATGDLWIDTGSMNLLPWSQDFTNAAWVKTAGGGGVTPTVTANAGVAPDGTTTADRIAFSRTSTGGEDASSVYQYTSSVPTSPNVKSLWVKSGDGNTQHILVWASTGYEEIVVGNTWQRVYRTDTYQVNYLQLGLHRGRGTVDPTTCDILVWQAQVTNTPGLARDIPTTSSAVSTIGYNKPYRWSGTSWEVSTSSDLLNLTLQPEINAGKLEAFYNFHKLHKKFIYPHPVYGDMAVKFNRPLVIPKCNHRGGGSIEPFELEFIEVPGGL